MKNIFFLFLASIVFTSVNAEIRLPAIIGTMAGYKSPLYKNMKMRKHKIRICFDGADNGLVTKGGTLTNFYIAAEDKSFVPAQVKSKGNRLIVWSNTIKNRVAVCFGFSNKAMPNLYSRSGLPVNLFRMDGWSVNTIAVK